MRKRGQIMALGYLDEEVPFAMRPLIFREVSVIGCTGFTHESDTVLKLMALRRIDVRPLITHRFPLGEINTAFETACSPGSGAIKVMVHP